MEQGKFITYLNEYSYLLSLYLNKKEDTNFIVDDEVFSFFYKLSEHHSLRSILYLALKETKVYVSKDNLDKLTNDYLLNVRKTVQFNEERNKLFSFLNDNQIDYLPLKGIVLKDLYFDSYSREFADNDILFSNKEDIIKKYFVDNGYKAESYGHGCHDTYIKKPFFNFEMHRKLFAEEENNRKIAIYFDNYISKAVLKDNHEYYLRNEDFYLYFTAHTYKHFHVSGCGIRTLIDYYLMFKNYDLDFEYINSELSKIDLLDFSIEIKNLSLKIFNNEPLSQQEKDLLIYIASSGTYGTIENSVKKGIEEKGKFRYFMSRIFPPLSFYKEAYPWAYKRRILIPFAWLARCFRILFKNPKNAKNEIKAIHNSNAKKK